MFPNMFPKDFSGFFSVPDPSSMDDMMKPGREAFEYWISFFPTAPLFGVEYRFGDLDAMSKSMMMPGFPQPAAKKPATKNVKAEPAKKAASAEAAAMAPVAKAPAPAPKPAEPVAPVKAVETAPAPAPAKPKAAPKKAAAMPKAKEAPASDGKPAALLAEKPTKVDDLKLIKGIGPGLEKELNRLGVYRFDQMAGFSKADLEWIDANLSAFKGRCFRDDWVGQSKALLG